jgi:hypothetical protein
VIFFDEAHEAGSTKQTRKILQHASHSQTKTVFVTATPYKVKFYHAIPNECCYTWSLDDIAAIQHRDLEFIDRRYPGFSNLASHRLSSPHELHAMYDIFPKLRWYDITFSNDPSVDQAFSNDVIDYAGFSMKSLFHCTERSFSHEYDVNLLFRRLERVFTTIQNQPGNGRTFRSFTGILMFLPFGNSQRIKKVGEITSYIEMVKSDFPNITSPSRQRSL